MSEVVSTTSPLANSFQRCSSSFKRLYIALFAYGPISLSKFNDEYGRFGVWGGDSGADRTGRGSLDDVLRTDPKTTSIIAEVLENLNEDLNLCIALAEASTGPKEAQSQEGQEWLSDEESSVGSRSDSGSDRSRSKILNKTQRILHLLAIIVDHIQSLFQVSALLRRPTISDKYLRSASRKTDTKTDSPFLPWDLAHITEKTQFWINQQHSGLLADKGKAGDIQYQTANYLCSRLAIANVRRREQLEFWHTHPAQPSTIKLPDERAQPKPATLPDPTPTSQLPNKTAPQSERSKPSHGTKQSFSTVAKSDLNDSATFSGRPRTEYVSSVKGGKYVLRIPPVPKISDESPTIKCPYCSASLDAKSMLQRELWKKHVFRDLRPYICTFEQCDNPEKLYLTRHDWMYHETQMHRRQWICVSCSHQKFSSRSDMKSHLLAKHTGQFPESQLMIMVDICERPVDDDEDADCPICLSTLSLSALRAHLATHLEELALFVLPLQMEDRSQQGSDKAEGAVEQPHGSDASTSEDGLPHLDFEKSSPSTLHSQDSAGFSSFLQNTKEVEHKHIENWFSINDQPGPQEDGESAEIVTPQPINPDIHLSSTGTIQEREIIIKNFLADLVHARRLRNKIEQLATNIVDNPQPKSAVTVGATLSSLQSGVESLRLRDSNLIWSQFPKIRENLRRCIGIMEAIVKLTVSYIRRPTSMSAGEDSIWKSDISFDTVAENLEILTGTLQKVTENINDRSVLRESQDSSED